MKSIIIILLILVGIFIINQYYLEKKIEHFGVTDFVKDKYSSAKNFVEDKGKAVESVAISKVSALTDSVLSVAKNNIESKIVDIPVFKNNGLTTSDIDPTVSLFFTINNILLLKNNPDQFFTNLVSEMTASDGLINKLLAIGKTKLIQVLTPIFQQNNLTIGKLEPILDLLDTVNDYENFDSNTQEFTNKLLLVSKPLFIELSDLVINKAIPDTYQKHDKILDFGTSNQLTSMSNSDSSGCINSLSLSQAELKCSENTDCDGFYMYDTTSPSRVCFKSSVDTSQTSKASTPANSAFFTKNINEGFVNYKNNTNDWSTEIFKSQFSSVV